MRAFQAAGWRVVPVDPNEPVAEGLPAGRPVADIVGPSTWSAFTCRPPSGQKLLSAIGAKTPGEVWLNPGAENRELLAEAARLGLKTVPICSTIAVGFSPADFP